MAVEVILKKPVPSLGAEADLVKVKPGYARNYLFPRDLAVVATAATKKLVEELRRRRAAREAAELNAAEQLATALKKVTITFQVETSRQDKVFGSITVSDIAARLETLGHIVDRRKIVLAKPLKSLGEYEVEVHLPQSVHGKFKVVLESANKDAGPAEDEVPRKKGPRKPRAEKPAGKAAEKSVEA
ncbi:MAG: 50S ribosomal protein L9 [Verrucomicrobiales bacterium]|jgi:large subunit ribosomal protein L9|nr:50S ribosomal protein L9 [Verrucomicrobiales bacterium]